MAASAQAAARFQIHGRVQGVGFRYSARERARSLGLVGFVRNCADGSVELTAEGDRSQLEKLAAWLERGPSMARVERVDRSDGEPSGRYRSFSVSL